jgi:phosphopantothenoylcysteine decarboxylase/phosphopantothenate--cysteine ligase
VLSKRILLIISGGIAAYKTPDLVRQLRKRGFYVRCILTRGGVEFVSPLALQAVSEEKVYQEIFSLNDESEMGHIQLSRDADVVLIAPATAHIIARMAHGLADDLATTAILATDKPVFIAPAMNVRMWEHAATQDNLSTLAARGVEVIGPDEGDMACGEFGLGRMAEPLQIAEKMVDYFDADKPLSGKRALVTSGPTFEAIDPVRFIGNRSSGKQGHAIAAALSSLGAETVLVSGPTHQADPVGVDVNHVQSAREMLAACEAALPADIVVCAAAVSDWRVVNSVSSKIKKTAGEEVPSLTLTENPDILATIASLKKNRPDLVIGFAAETNDVIDNAIAKRQRKNCDWIIANDVSPQSGTFDGDSNTVHVISKTGVEDWPSMSKTNVGLRLAKRIAAHFTGESE